MICLSVIIPTRNRSRLLNNTLASIQRQTYSRNNFEVLIIDNGSTDDTQSVVARHASQCPNIRYIFEGRPGLHEGRHAGLREASGQILVFADDDIEAFPSWLEGIKEGFTDQRVGLVGGKNLPNYESRPPSWLEEFWETNDFGRYLPHLSLGDFGETSMQIHPDFVFGCNFSIRKDLLINIKGFHPDGMPENLMIYRGDGETYVGRQVQRHGYVSLYNPKASVKHWVPTDRMTLDYFKKRMFMSGISQSFTDSRELLAIAGKKMWVRLLVERLKQKKRLLMATPVKSQVLRSYYEGYEYHQRELKNNRTLLEWVLKENYL